MRRLNTLGFFFRKSFARGIGTDENNLVKIGQGGRTDLSL